MAEVTVRPDTQEEAGMGLSVLLSQFTAWFAGEAALMSRKELADTAEVVERISRLVSHAQLVAARAIDEQNLAACGESETSFTWDVPAGEKSEFRNTAEFLRARLGIGLGEAKRRLRTGAAVLSRAAIGGEPLEPVYADLGAAVAGGLVSAPEATMITAALGRMAPLTDPETLAAMEQSLTVLATETDTDAVGRAIRVWEARIDADGKEPTEEVLRIRQGAFLRGRRHGLNLIDIAATDEQFETLMTVMNTAANPRVKPCPDTPAEPGGAPGGAAGGAADTAAGPGGAADGVAALDAEAGAGGSGGVLGGDEGPELDRRTRAQKLLDGLVGGCQLALATDQLPATGGHRPQILATIDYQDLFNQLTTTTTNTNTTATNIAGANATGTGGAGVRGGVFSYSGPVAAGTLRKIACDAEIIPVVLGGAGQVLDQGRAKRLYTPAQRKALIARDGGCAFPGCTMPPHWTEAHHIDYWAGYGHTSVDRGVLLCSFHHHLIHHGNWIITVEDGIPWFTPPAYLDPYQRRRRNTYFHPHRRRTPANGPTATSAGTTGTTGRSVPGGRFSGGTGWATIPDPPGPTTHDTSPEPIADLTPSPKAHPIADLTPGPKADPLAGLKADPIADLQAEPPKDPAMARATSAAQPRPPSPHNTPLPEATSGWPRQQDIDDEPFITPSPHQGWKERGPLEPFDFPTN